MNTSYQIGSALGLAAMVAVSSSWTARELSSGNEKVNALNDGFQAAFAWSGIIVIVCALLVLFFIRKPKV